jgi:hypothetical protein
LTNDEGEEEKKTEGIWQQLIELYEKEGKGEHVEKSLMSFLLSAELSGKELFIRTCKIFISNEGELHESKRTVIHKRRKVFQAQINLTNNLSH